MSSSQIVFLHVVPEGSEAHAQQFGGFDLDTAGALQRFGQVAAFDLLHVRLEIETGGRQFGIRSRRGRGCRTRQSVAGDIRDRRTYQAIASLTRQSRSLRQTGTALKDSELLRDAAILSKYADRLYDFDGELFQTVKIWNDLSWDTERFRNVFR